jgi:LmbE family N-acetylglucosaminyl deacetylase
MDLRSCRALFLQPHFDDAALSVGGTIALAAGRGEHPVVVTVFAGDPPPGDRLGPVARELHRRWGTGDATGPARRAEDDAACARLGARPMHLPHGDAIYRDGRYPNGPALTGALHQRDRPLVGWLGAELVALWRRTARAAVHLPLAVGRHVDHQLVAAAAEPLERAGAEVARWEDFPYLLREQALGERLAAHPELAPRVVDVRATFERRIEAIGCYRSQLSTLFDAREPWPPLVEQHARRVAGGGLGERLWVAPR